MSLVGCSPWSCKGLNTTEWLSVNSQTLIKTKPKILKQYSRFTGVIWPGHKFLIIFLNDTSPTWIYHYYEKLILYRSLWNKNLSISYLSLMFQKQVLRKWLEYRYIKAEYCHLAYSTAEYIMRNAGLDEAQAGIKIARRNINNSDIQMTPLFWQKTKKN